MILHITILEDENTYARQLQILLEEWSRQHGIEISLRHFYQSEDFFTEDYEEDELFFLDIDLKTSNGIDVAKKLRNDGFRGHIIFLTAFSEYVFDGYQVQALDYLLKPIDIRKLSRCMKPVMKDREESCYTYRTKSQIVRIPYHKITAFTSYKHYVDIITSPPVSPSDKNGSACYRQKITLKALEQQLPKQFIRCHRTVIVNINKVMKLTNTDVILSDQSVYPVSESYLKRMREAFLELLE